MVLESLLNPLSAEKRPWEMFFIGFAYSSVAILLSLWIFRDQTSLIMVFLTVMASLPIVYNTMKLEEGKDLEISKVVFYSRDYCMLAYPDEKIEASGVVEEVTKNTGEKYYRIVIGYFDSYLSERMDSEYIKMIEG